MGRAAKLPAFQFYYGDHKRDAALSRCRPSTRGIWMDWLCDMHDADRSGQIVGTAEQLARSGRCSIDEAEAAFKDLEFTGAADVNLTPANGIQPAIYTVTNRRMRREFLARKSNAERQKRHYEKKNKREPNAQLTENSRPLSSVSISIPSSKAHSTLNGPEPGEWQAVAEEVFAFGVRKSCEAVAAMRHRGASPSDIRELLKLAEHWRQQRSLDDPPAALFSRMANWLPGQKAHDGWPTPAKAVGSQTAGFRPAPRLERVTPDEREASRELFRSALNGKTPCQN